MNSKTYKCIYCLEKKSHRNFTKREHVIPESFGGFINNFTLINIVCDECNLFFGQKLELHLARDTFEGSTLRYQYDIQEVDNVSINDNECYSSNTYGIRADGDYNKITINTCYNKM